MNNVRFCFWALTILFLALVSRSDSQWVQTSGPEGGFVGPFVTSGSYVFVNVGTSIYRSSDNGTTWTHVKPNFATVNSFALIGSTLFAGVGSGVYVSSDNGATWTISNNGLSASFVYQLLYAGSTLFAGTAGGGVFRSTDNGLNWISATTGMNASANVASMCVTGTNILAVTTVGGNDSLFRSTDNGQTWTRFGSGLPVAPVYSLYANGATVFAGTANGLYRSTNNGSDWTRPTTSPNTAYSFGLVGASLFCATLDTLNPVYMTTDNGASWTAVNNGIRGANIKTLGVSGTTLLCGGDNLFRSTNSGSSWTKSGTNIINTPISTALVADANSVFAGYVLYNGTSMMHKSTNTGTVWNSIRETFPAGGNVRALFLGTTYLYAAVGNVVHRSSNGGTTWSAGGTGLPTGGSGGARCLLEVGTRLLAGTTTSGVYVSTDNGTTWSVSNSGLPGGSQVNALAERTGYIYAGLQSGGIYRSSNNGASWTVHTAPTMVVSGFTKIDSVLFVSSSGSGTQCVYKSLGNGSAWQSAGFGLPGNIATGVVATGGMLFVANAVGIYRSANQGSSWSNAGMNSGFPSYVIPNSLVIGGNMMYAGTQYGVWRRPLNELVTSVREIDGRVADFHLEQNYPNPFNPGTIIRFQIPQLEMSDRSRATLKVYDMLGRQVCTLVDEDLPSGVFETRFDGSNLSSGVYVYRLVVGGLVESKRMQLLR